MPIYKTQAIILAKRQIWEADRMYIMYTRDFGKVEAQVKSAVKTTSKLAGSLEPVSLVEVMIVKGKSRETIAGVQLIERYKINNIETIAQTALIRELFIKLVKPGVKEQILFNNLILYFKALEKVSDINLSRFITQRFIWQMINILGHGINEEINQMNELSVELKEILNSCVQQAPTSLQVSNNLLKELESFTKKYLYNLIESDLNSFHFSILYTFA